MDPPEAGLGLLSERPPRNRSRGFVLTTRPHGTGTHPRASARSASTSRRTAKRPPTRCRVERPGGRTFPRSSSSVANSGLAVAPRATSPCAESATTTNGGVGVMPMRSSAAVSSRGTTSPRMLMRPSTHEGAEELESVGIRHDLSCVSAVDRVQVSYRNDQGLQHHSPYGSGARQLWEVGEVACRGGDLLGGG